MPEYKITVEITLTASNEESAMTEAWSAMTGDRALRDHQYQIGDPVLVPEVMNPDSDEFERGYANEVISLDTAGAERIRAAYETLQTLQGAASNYDYGRMRACQEVVDEARKLAHGGFGFSGTPAGQARIDSIVKGGW